jgi:hypothetical protein
LLDFSNSISITEIPKYIERRKDEKKNLENEIISLQEQKENLEAHRSATHDLLDIALHDEKITTAGLRWYSDI